jgi:hypothetical protein
MDFPADGFHIFLLGVRQRIGPADGRTWGYPESLIRTDYDQCHLGETFDDLKRRAQFSKEDQGLLRDWMAVAAQRAAERADSASPPAPRAAA